MICLYMLFEAFPTIYQLSMAKTLDVDHLQVLVMFLCCSVRMKSQTTDNSPSLVETTDCFASPNQRRKIEDAEGRISRLDISERLTERTHRRCALCTFPISSVTLVLKEQITSLAHNHPPTTFSPWRACSYNSNSLVQMEEVNHFPSRRWMHGIRTYLYHKQLIAFIKHMWGLHNCMYFTGRNAFS